MQLFRTVLLCSLTMLVCVVSNGQGKYSKVKIFAPEDRRERAELLGLLEIDHFMMHEGAIVAEISNAALSKLSQSRVSYEVLVPDIAAHVREQNRAYYAATEQERVAMEQPGGTVGSMIATPSAFQVQSSLGGF